MTDIFVVASAFLMHSGARHLNFSLTDAQKKLLDQPLTKFVILTAMFYISTRNVGWSITMLLIYYVTVNMLLNENHQLNVFSRGWLTTHGFAKNTAEEHYTDMYKNNLQFLK